MGSGGEKWRQIGGGVGFGVGALALVASVSLFVATKRATRTVVPPAKTCLKSDLVYAASGADEFDLDSGIKQRRPPRDESGVAALQT
jgi:hypothetical protein